MKKRAFAASLLALSALAGTSCGAWADDAYPSKPIR